MSGLSTVEAIPSSPLMGCEDKNLWVTAGGDFLPHLRHLAVRKPVTWNFRVVSDAELVTAWLSSVALKGKDILDADAYMVSTKFLTIPDLVVPPDLLVIRMGVKVARNSASSEVLAEALSTRLHEMKPTWVWDEPDRPLNTGHLFWSEAVGRLLRSWDRMGVAQGSTPTSPRSSSQRGKRKTLRGGS